MSTLPPRPIVLVTEVFPPLVGGSATLFAQAYARVHDVDVTVLTSAPASEADSWPFAVRPLSPVPRSWSLLSGDGLSYYLRRAWHIRRAVRRTAAVVHVGRAVPEGVAATLSSVWSGTPVVVWVHGEELAYYRSSRELELLARLVFSRAAAILVNSHNTADELRRFGSFRCATVVAHPAVDPDVFTPALDVTALRRRLAPRGEVVLMSVGRLQRRKGHDLVLEALAKLPVDSPPWRYVVVGDGATRGELEAHVARLSLMDRVTFLGTIDGADLPAHFAACDVFVLPNRVDDGDFEGFGIVFLEAAAAGKPTVGGRTGGVSEAVDDGTTGYLVTGTDPRELCDILRRLIADESERHRLGRAGRQRVLDGFTWCHTAAAILACHRQVAGR